VDSYYSSPGLNLGQVMCYMWCTKWYWCRFSPSTSVSPANSYFTNSFTFISHSITDLKKTNLLSTVTYLYFYISPLPDIRFIGPVWADHSGRAV
jgi:hypothetical protein